jgi:hypothetical protein
MKRKENLMISLLAFFFPKIRTSSTFYDMKLSRNRIEILLSEENPINEIETFGGGEPGGPGPPQSVSCSLHTRFPCHYEK